MSYEWQDPFADDEAARERERRRAEREARRRQRRKSLAAKVGQQRADGAEAASAGQQRADGAEAASAGRAPDPPDQAPGQTPGSAPRPPGEPPRPVTGRPVTAAGPSVATRASGAANPPRRRAGGVEPDRLMLRRLLGVLIVAAVAGLVVFGVAQVIDGLGGSDAPVAPPKAAKVEDVTIPEGLDRRQVADLAKDAGLRGDYTEATKKAPKGFDVSKYGAEGAPNLEGFLFPATYELEKDATARDLVARQLDAFRDNLAGVDLSYAKSKNLNVYDVLKIASMVEREVQVPSERRLVAGVIYNRLAAGTPLGIDATIRYEDENYDEPLTESRLNKPTPYNTRLNPGLPPTPIGNPGLDSIEAAAKPAKTDYFYFVVKPCGEGKHVFAKTQAQFDQASADYRRALEKQGGSPTDC